MTDSGDSVPDDPAVGASLVATKRRRLRAVLLSLIGLLYVISIPWYRETGAPLKIVFGLPDWVAVAIGCYFAVAVLNSWAWLITDVPDHDEREPTAAGRRGRSG